MINMIIIIVKIEIYIICPYKYSYIILMMFYYQIPFHETPPGVFIPNSITLPLGIMPPPGLTHPDGYLEIVRPVHYSIVLPSGSSVSNEYIVRNRFGFTIIRREIHGNNLGILHRQIGIVTKDILMKHIENFDLQQLLDFTDTEYTLDQLGWFGFDSVGLEIIVRMIIIAYFEWMNIGGGFKIVLFRYLSKYMILTDRIKKNIADICIIFKILKY